MIIPRNIMGGACVKCILLREDKKDRMNLAQCSRPVVGSCEQNHDAPMGSIKIEEFLD
jgi:hypothetical protein